MFEGYANNPQYNANFYAQYYNNNPNEPSFTKESWENYEDQNYGKNNTNSFQKNYPEIYEKLSADCNNHVTKLKEEKNG